VTVFDDMVVRSVPFYCEMHRMIGELTKDFAVKGTNVYDLGCSTGTTMLNLDKVLPDDIHFVGIDNSDEMLIKCQNNLKNAGVKRKVRYENQDLNHDIELENPSVVIFCLTLQFLRPLKRESILKKICESLPENGAVILIEKILTEESICNRLFIEHYYEFKKRNGYNETEIAKKRESLENVLVPYKLSENEELLKSCRFRYTEVFFKWYNFAGIIAIK
ncbi:carboxy-S-adenosyl-L-methionine synthase CmoA, partial [Muriicola sp.]|uniref:carboxy-S-adenosyl-L-methionine synthase CmoA n=1 Tax=Muriicola sp. TaxID=2020856 RepID=UPI003C708AAE